MALRDRLDRGAVPPTPELVPPLLPAIDGRRVLNSIDLTRHLSEEKYDRQLEALQGRLNLLSRDPKFARSRQSSFSRDRTPPARAARSGASPARSTRGSTSVIPIAAPTEEERAQPYLWRFWRHLPRLGRFTIFDRSWYGRVLVERVEGFCSEADWLRAYSEINDFEEQLVESRRRSWSKFWLQISKEEQLRRFKEREQTSFKRFKITGEDWRNREKWDAYEIAA